MKFYNRQKELKELEKSEQLSRESSSQLTLVTGVRRSGKTELIVKHFGDTIQKGKSLYLFIPRKKSLTALEDFNRNLKTNIGISLSNENFDVFFENLFTYAQQNGIGLIFDEFQNFKYIDPSVFSIFQKHWDSFRRKKGLNIVIAGSIISLIQKIFFDDTEPLYNRITGRVHLDELNFKTIFEILNDNKKKTTTIEDLLTFYTVFGGLPYYYKIIIDRGELESKFNEIINSYILSLSGILREEVRDNLIQSFGSEHLTYFSILESIALNINSFNSIVNRTGSSSSIISRALETLESDFKLIAKLTPIFPNNQRIFRYSIQNNFVSFWFRYIYPNQSLLNSGREKIVEDKIINDLSSLMGYTFEKLASDVIYDKYMDKKLDFDIVNIGKWWDKSGEIDIVVDGGKDEVVFIECKLNERSISEEEVTKLLETSNRVDAVKSRNKKYYFFCASGVSKSRKELLNKYNIGLFEEKDLLDYLRK